jgi:RNA polymerase sigma-70 factor (ECF subfamily)
MDASSITPCDDTPDLIRRATAGEVGALVELFGRYRKRLRQMVRLRLDHRLQGRVDPSEVIQDAYIDAAQRLPEFGREGKTMPFYLWLRLVTGERLLRVHRQHLGAVMRDAGREVSLHRGALPQASSESLAAQLLGRLTTPSQAMVRTEVQVQLQQVINRMEATDREIIVLRHFEELSNAEAAQVLGITPRAAGNRHVRAMARLQAILRSIPGLLEQAPA